MSSSGSNYSSTTVVWSRYQNVRVAICRLGGLTKFVSCANCPPPPPPPPTHTHTHTPQMVVSHELVGVTLHACLKGDCLHLRTSLHSTLPWMPWTWHDVRTTSVCGWRSCSGHVLPWPYRRASCFWPLTECPKQHPAMSVIKSNILFSWGWAQGIFSC